MNNIKAYIAEFSGTYALVLVGPGAIVLNDVYNGRLSHTGVALAFGLIVTLMIVIFGRTSGAHINPAVSIAAWLSDQLSSHQVLPYIISQCLGAMAAGLTLQWLFPKHMTLGATLPRGLASEAFLLEIFLSFVLMYVILNVVRHSFSRSWMPGLLIGATVGLEAFFAGPITGASMNPARSLGPALASGQLQHLWLYIAAPIIGMLLAIPACRCTYNSDCCKRRLKTL